MSEIILVAGGTGFTGSRTVPMLARRGLDLRCLVRREGDAQYFKRLGAEPVFADLEDPGSLAMAFEGVSGLISMVGLHTGHAAAMVDAAVAAGVKRALFVTSTSIFTRPDTSTKRHLLEAEKRIRDSGLDYTIIRPTMVYGDEQDRNICRLIRYLARWPVLFIPGPGTWRVQPVYVDDAAGAIADAWQTPGTIGKCYNISGREPLTFNALVDTVSALLKRKIMKIHLPVSPLVAACKRAETAGLSFFVRSDQIERLNEDKSFAHDEATADFQFAPVSFETGVRREIEAMGLIREEGQ
ncbi:MAG: NAD(P)H-binding protein [Thermodesulfobacteriota bacterium]